MSMKAKLSSWVLKIAGFLWLAIKNAASFFKDDPPMYCPDCQGVMVLDGYSFYCPTCYNTVTLSD